MKKKLMILTSLLLTICMVLPLTGCYGGAPGADSGKTTLTFWTHNDEDTWNASYQAMAEGFMSEHPDVEIHIEAFPYDEYKTKIQTALMSDKGGADIYELWGGWASDFVPTGSLAALPDDLAKQVVSEAYESTYGTLQSDGKLYGIPQEFNIECGGLIVNNNILNEDGLSVPTTWDELVDNGIKGTVKNDNGEIVIKGFDFVNEDGVMYLFTSMILSQGEEYMNPDGTFNFSTDAAKKAWEELAGLAMETDRQTTNLSGLDDGSDIEGYQELYAGQVMMVPRGPWCIAEGENEFELEYGKDYSYVEMPFYGPEKRFAAETGWSMGVGSSIPEEKQALAFDFLRYVFSDGVILNHNIACGQIPAKKSVAESEEYVKGFEYATPLLKILDGGQYIGNFNTGLFKDAVNETFSLYCKDGYESTDAALKELEDRCNEIERD
ncbi:MAG: extracellular solute-binding protein [Lachnospiraceae bacterium]|nr:extracellular solute-binding protein [Lachnospiraceae bacterium]